MSEIFSQQLTAVATAALAVLAAATAILAGLALRKQSREVSAVQDQLKVQREDSDARRSESLREQAGRVSLWVERRSAGEETAGLFAPSRVVITATIRNASELPIFVVDIAAYHPNGRVHDLWGRPEHLDVLMAYDTRRFTRTVDIPHEYAGIDFFFGDPVLSARFRDNAGKRWTADSEGNLTPDQPPV